MGKLIDLTGQVFGELTVLARDYDYVKEHNIKQNRPYWKCKCSCGTITTVSGGNLTQENGVKRCMNCRNKNMVHDITGQISGNLTVLEYSKTVNRKAYFKCLCKCGNIIEACGRDLNQKKIQSCGCINSKGEQTIIQLLEENNIPFEKQKSFNTCRSPQTNSLLFFDFYVDNKFLLEYDGIQHFKYYKSGWNTKQQFLLNKEQDEYKNKWCKENNIPLKRIPYWELDTLTINGIMSDLFLIKEG